MRLLALIALLGLAATAFAGSVNVTGTLASLPKKNLTKLATAAAAMMPAKPAGKNYTDPASQLPVPAYKSAAITNKTLLTIQKAINKTGYAYIPSKSVNKTTSILNKIQVVDTWLNNTYIPKANRTSPLAGAEYTLNQKLTNAVKTVDYVYNQTAAKAANAILSKTNLPRQAKP